MPNFEKWIGVDLDGTLAEYHEWVSPIYIGEPIPKMVARVKRWISEGKTVKIFTARVSPKSIKHNNTTIEEVTEAIDNWIFNVFGCFLPITHEKDFGMEEIWDDIAFRIIKNTGQESERQAMERERERIVVEIRWEIKKYHPEKEKSEIYALKTLADRLEREG